MEQANIPLKTEASLGLRPTQQAIMDCAACFTIDGGEVTPPAVVQCRGLKSNTARYNLVNLEKLNLVECVNPNNKPHRYTLTALGQQQATANPECPLKQIAEPTIERPVKDDELSDIQRQVLDCLRCQVAKGRTPNAPDTALCLGRRRATVRYTAAALATKNIISIGAGRHSALRGSTKTQAYAPVDVKSFSSKNNPDCHLEKKIVKVVYDRLSAERKQALGCLACIDDKIADGLPLPGASGVLLEKCAKITTKTNIYPFLRELDQEGFVTTAKGYTQRQVFLRPTAKGQDLLALHRQAQPGFNADCQNTLSEITTPPVHTRNAVIKCIGCIWTRQAAAGQPLVVTPPMLSACTGLNERNINGRILPAFEEDGLMRRAPDQRNHLYLPTNALKITLGYAPDCNLRPGMAGEIDGALLEELPDVISRQADQDIFREFEAYVQKIATADRESEEGWEGFFGRLAANHPLLKPEEEAYLGMIIQQNPNPTTVQNAIDTFLRHNVRLAIWMANRSKFETWVTSFEDTVQAALIGVDRAAKTFNPLLGLKFSTHAFWSMRGAIGRNTHQQAGVSWLVLQAIPTMLWHRAEFKRTHGKNPSLLELAASMDKSVDAVRTIIDTHRNIELRSFDRTLRQDGEATGHDVIGQEDQGQDLVEFGQVFSRILPYLTALDKGILRNIIRGESIPKTFGADYGVTEYQVRLHRAKVQSIIQHPYFGVGVEYDARRLGWQEQAQCFVENAPGFVTGNIEAATICNRCPVQKQCSVYAATASPPITYGIWGGKNYGHQK